MYLLSSKEVCESGHESHPTYPSWFQYTHITSMHFLAIRNLPSQGRLCLGPSSQDTGSALAIPTTCTGGRHRKVSLSTGRKNKLRFCSTLIKQAKHIQILEQLWKTRQITWPPPMDGRLLVPQRPGKTSLMQNGCFQGQGKDHNTPREHGISSYQQVHPQPKKEAMFIHS